MKHLFIHVPKTGGYTIRKHGNVTSYVHHTASELSGMLPDFWDRYRFCMVRNPYDRFLSAYMYYRQMGPSHEFWDMEADRLCAQEVHKYATFEKFVYGFNYFKFKSRIHFRPQVNWTHIGNTQAVDYVGRFEEYDRSWQYICQQIGVPYSVLPVTNACRHSPWRFYYTGNMRRVVQSIFMEDFDAFGYQLSL